MGIWFVSLFFVFRKTLASLSQRINISVKISPTLLSRIWSSLEPRSWQTKHETYPMNVGTTQYCNVGCLHLLERYGTHKSQYGSSTVFWNYETINFYFYLFFNSHFICFQEICWVRGWRVHLNRPGNPNKDGTGLLATIGQHYVIWSWNTAFTSAVCLNTVGKTKYKEHICF